MGQAPDHSQCPPGFAMPVSAVMTAEQEAFALAAEMTLGY
jgi:hypothetical protein